VFVPAGTWHNIINTGDCPIKLYSIYAPPKHPHSTVHLTKEIAELKETEIIITFVTQ
jgi:mannose-6-phosphate isomerase-like protein (cupin superfamily)